MKRLFVSELDTLLGKRVCELFSTTKEYEITGTVRNNELEYLLGARLLPPYVSSVTPSYRTGNVAFKEAILRSDIIVCLTRDDVIEAEAAAKMLRNEHYEVEKTLVVLSSVMTWADTVASRKAQEKAEKEADRAERIANGEDVDDEEAPPEEEEEPTVLRESEYQGRVPHRRYQHWKDLEVLVKQANSATLHTHVIFAGLMYGMGEEALGDAFRLAWHQQRVPMYTAGTNVVPMIHVQDLAQIIFKTASADEESSQRYILAVDRGNNTLGSVLQTIATKVGNGNTTTMTDSQIATLPYSELLRIDMRMEPESAFDIHAEDEWYAPNGFVDSFDRVAAEYREAHRLTPIRALLLGPPRAGKTTIAERLAAEYRIQHLNISRIIADYSGYLETLQSDLRKHRASRKRARKQAEYNQTQEEAREAREAAKAAAEEGDGDRDDDEADRPEDEEGEEDDVSELGFNNSGYHLLAADESAERAPRGDDDEGGEGEEDEDEQANNKSGGAIIIEEEEEEDDPEDEIAAFLVEQLQRAKDTFALKIRVGLKPRVEGDEGDEEDVDEDGNPIVKPLPPGVRLRFVDEALAAMARWRLQQKDCLNQGYILEGFPKNVRQAQLMFQVDDVALPSLEEIKEREYEPLPAMDLSEATASVDAKLLPDVCIHLYADDALLLGRVDDSTAHTSMEHFVKRLRLYKADHDPNKLSDTSLITWVKSTNTQEQEVSTEHGFVAAVRPRQMFYVEVAAGSLLSDDSSKRCMNYLRATLGDRHFITPTVSERKAAECEKEHAAQLQAFQAQRAEEKRVEDERLESERHQREVAVHARRYRSIAEEKTLAKSITDLPMETYLAQFVLHPVAKGVERVIAMRPEDPVKALADFLFEYEPRKGL